LKPHHRRLGERSGPGPRTIEKDIRGQHLLFMVDATLDVLE